MLSFVPRYTGVDLEMACTEAAIGVPCKKWRLNRISRDERPWHLPLADSQSGFFRVSVGDVGGPPEFLLSRNGMSIKIGGKKCDAIIGWSGFAADELLG